MTRLALLLLIILVSSVLTAGKAAADLEGILPPDSKRPLHDKWALIIGVSKFKDQSLNLKYPAKDAKDFADFLVKEANFAQDHVKLLLDEKATRENILDAIGDKFLPRVTHHDDLILIYISSHGSPDAMDIGGVNYIIAHDTDKERLYSTGIAMQDLARIVKRVRTDRVLLLLDACHSGAASVADQKGLIRTGNISADEVAQGTGQLVVCSSGTNEVSWESRRYPNSVFTHCLIESLRSKGSDTKLGDAFTQLKEQVEFEVRRDRGAQQVPVIKGQWQGDELMVSLRPTHPGPGLEEEVINTVSPAPPENVSSPTPAPQDTVAIVPPAPTTATPSGATVNVLQQKTVSPPAVPTPTPTLVAVLPFAGPEEVECKGGSLMTMVRSKGFKHPREGDFATMPEALREMLAEKLKEKLGDGVKGPKELSGKTAASFYSQNVGAEYLIEGAIHKIQYDPGDLFGNKYEIEFSADLLSGATRKQLASIREHKIQGFVKSDTDPLAQMYTHVLERISSIIMAKMLTKIQH